MDIYKEQSRFWRLLELTSVPISSTGIQSHAYRTIFHRSNVRFGTVEHTFSVDSSIVEIMLSITGHRINISVTTPQGEFFILSL